jgi:UDP-N-acetylglucosamine 2-epimerase (non-hydrolysing)
MEGLERVSKEFKCDLILPVHPRTRLNLRRFNIQLERIRLIDPLDYLGFLQLESSANLILTDSGGIQEESCVLMVPCVTLRENTERPETITIGTNELLGTDPQSIKPAMDILLKGNWKKGGIPELWDGNTSKRIVNHIFNILKQTI